MILCYVMHRFKLKRQRWVASICNFFSLRVAVRDNIASFWAKTCSVGRRLNQAFSPLDTEQNKHNESEKRFAKPFGKSCTRSLIEKRKFEPRWVSTKRDYVGSTHTEAIEMLWRHYENLLQHPEKRKRKILKLLSL